MTAPDYITPHPDVEQDTSTKAQTFHAMSASTSEMDRSSLLSQLLLTNDDVDAILSDDEY